MDKAIEFVNLLISKGYKVSTAESCTGGMIASEIVSVENASKVLDISFVTYSPTAKNKYLGVSNDTIRINGIVSEEVAQEMAKGLKKESNANVVLCTTGIAGPGGGTSEKPVGMVCFGIGIDDSIYTFTKYFGDLGRNKVREEATKSIFEEAIKLLSK